MGKMSVKKKAAAKRTTKKKAATATLRDARSLADLMKIRAAPENRAYLDSINGTLGTALGFKKETGENVSQEPAILVFVPHKIDSVWLDESQEIRRELIVSGSGGRPGIRCRLDVVAGGRADVLPQEPALSTDNAILVNQLAGGFPFLTSGSRLAVLHSSALGDVVGTLGAFARRLSDGKTGFITNDHVALGNRRVFHPQTGVGKSVGFRVNTFLEAVKPDVWYGDFAAEPDAPDSMVHIDCEFLRVDSDVTPDRIQPGLPTLGTLGGVFEIDLQGDMTATDTAVIGQRVLKVGQKTGITRGTIAAFGYEWHDEFQKTRYTDLLIQPDTTPSGQVPTAFSLPGDSGSLICIEVGRRPIGLLWGGRLEKLVGGKAQENWTYASRIDQILKILKLELI